MKIRSRILTPALIAVLAVQAGAQTPGAEAPASGYEVSASPAAIASALDPVLRGKRGSIGIAVYSVAERTGAMALEQHISTEGDWPRNFSLDPSGNWLLVANERSGSVIVLRRDPRTGRLASTGTKLDVPRAVCVRFRAHVGVTA